MKKLILGLLFSSILFPAYAASFSTRLMRAVLQPTQTAERLAQVTGCLRDRKQCTVLTWREGATFYNQADQNRLKRKELLAQYQQERELLQLPTRNPAQVPFKEEYIPGALDQLRPSQFYFVGETHKPHLSALAHQVIRQIRAKLPADARVLLATEFVTAYAGPDARVLRRAKEGHEDFNVTSEEQAPLFALADELNMDLLSLDDKWLEELHAPNGKPIYPVKVGDFLVEADSNFEEVEQVISRTTSSANPVMRLLHLRHFLLGSPWGIEQRNAQWARYLQALQSDYDAIIVYAGQGHLDPLNEYTTALPQLLGLKNYARLFVEEVSPAEKPAIALYGELSEFRWPRHPHEHAQYQTLQTLEQQLGIFQNEEMFVRITIPQNTGNAAN